MRTMTLELRYYEHPSDSYAQYGFIDVIATAKTSPEPLGHTPRLQFSRVATDCLATEREREHRANRSFSLESFGGLI